MDMSCTTINKGIDRPGIHMLEHLIVRQDCRYKHIIGCRSVNGRGH
jgi:hypothetical protein